MDFYDCLPDDLKAIVDTQFNDDDMATDLQNLDKDRSPGSAKKAQAADVSVEDVDDDSNDTNCPISDINDERLMRLLSQKRVASQRLIRRTKHLEGELTEKCEAVKNKIAML